MATYDLTTNIPAASELLADDILNCTYTGSEITIELAAGLYKIECYGAHGGNNVRNSNIQGGEGGYSYGTISLEDDTRIYLNAGGQPTTSSSATSSTTTSGGYNGGGAAHYYGGAGGGATHVATASGLLSTLSSNTDAIIIVAGGGGGSGANATSTSTSTRSGYCGKGGAGGGTSGAAGTYATSASGTFSANTQYCGQGGTQTAGGAAGTYTSRTGSAGSFGQGGAGNGYSTSGTTYYGGGGGGGGYYGGGGCSRYPASGGGGSGYLSSDLTDSATSQGGCSGNGYIVITVLEIYSKTHTISFYNGTTVVGTVETAGEETITLPESPSKDGYKFLGWFLSDGITEITADSYATTALKEDISCFAQFRKYNVYFYVDDILTTTMSTTGKETATFPNDPVKEGYTFVDWYLEDDVTVFNLDYLAAAYLTDDLTVHAVFRQKYTVSFIADGTTYQTVSSSGYESIAAPTTTPTKEGYTFNGWFVDSACAVAYTEDYFSDKIISENTTIYGKFTEDVQEEPENPSNVTFIVNGSVYYTISTKGKETLTLPDDPVVDGYRFNGWYSDEGCTVEFTASSLENRWIAEDMSVYAKLTEIIKYSVIYLVNGKAYYTYKSAGYEDFKQPSNPNVANYEFQGWYWDDSYTNPYDRTAYEDKELTQSLNVYAKMKYTKKNNILFYLDTETTDVYATVSTSGCETIAMPDDPTPELGYDFAGWYLNTNLTTVFNEEYYETHNLTKDIAVYAKFVSSVNGPYALTIAKDGNGGVNPDVGTYTVTKGTTTTITITKNEENFKYLEVNEDTVDVTDHTVISPENAVSYFTFNTDSADVLGQSTVTTQGTPSIDTSTIKFGAGSIYFGGSAALIIELPDTFTDAFTVEFWFYDTLANTSGQYPTIFSTNNTSDGSTNSSGGIYCHVDDGSYSTYMVCRANDQTASSNNGSYGTTVVTRNAWHHFAYCRSGNYNYYFLDGVLQATVTQSNPIQVTTIAIGGLYRAGSFNSTDYYTGYVDDLLISNTCKYTSAFTVPTEAYNASTSTYWTYDIENQSVNTTATAYFGEFENFTVTSSAVDGTISPDGEKIIQEGTKQIYTCQGNNGQNLKALLVDGVAVETSKTGTYAYDDAICLAHFDEDIVDNLNQSTIVTHGSPEISTEQSKFGGSSLKLDGSSYLTITLPATYSDGFTVELWFYCTTENTSNLYPTPACWGNGTAYGQTYFHVDDGSYGTYGVCRSNLSTSSSSNGGYDETSVAITRNTWHHLVMSRTTSYCYFFVDGTLRYTVTNASPVSATQVCIGALVGASVDSKTYFTGYIDEVVIYPSTKHTTAFDVPTAAYEESLTDIVYSYTLKNIHSDRTVKAVFSPLLYLKIGAKWKGIAKVYKKIAGSWIEQSADELADIFSTEENYAQGTVPEDTEEEES